VRNLALVAVAVAIAIGVWLTRGRRSAHPNRSDVYHGLRNRALQASREKFGVPAPTPASAPWGVVMDWGTPSGSVTIVAISDGNASVYLSTGGGYLGGGASSEPIRAAARSAVDVAVRCQPQAHPTAEFPLPGPGEVIFYLLTDAGALVIRASEPAVRDGAGALTDLANRMQSIVTLYRTNKNKGGTAK
jgi:hypothetical protein